MATLDEIAALSDAKAKSEAYNTALCSTVQSKDLVACRQFVEHVLSDLVPLTLSRQLLTTFAAKLPLLPPDVQEASARHAVELIQPRAVSYEEPAAAIREQLSALYEAQEEWSAAARALAGIDLDSGMRVLDPEYKLANNVKIAMLFLEDDDAVAAESYIKKASSLVAGCKNQALDLRYKTCYARVLDSKRRFLEAATRYYELSQTQRHLPGGGIVGEEELEVALNAAITCTILAAAGPQRSRMLATLYKDERTAPLPVASFLEKVYLERILRPEEVAAFSRGLAEHQLALLPDGSTVLERSVTEHNLEAASKLYNNIYVEELGALLGVPAEQAEQAAARMVMERRLGAVIDQVEGLVTFTAAADPLAHWDASIASLCGAANAAVEGAAARGLLPAATSGPA